MSEFSLTWGKQPGETYIATAGVNANAYKEVPIDNVEFLPSRRFPVTMPRWERRRMQVAERDHAGLVLYRLQQAKWDKESAK